MKTTDTPANPTRGNAGKHVADPLRGAVRESLGIFHDQVESTRRALMRRSRDAAAATDGYVHAHPWVVIGAVGAIGLLAGLAFSRRPLRPRHQGASS